MCTSTSAIVLGCVTHSLFRSCSMSASMCWSASSLANRFGCTCNCTCSYKTEQSYNFFLTLSHRCIWMVSTRQITALSHIYRSTHYYKGAWHHLKYTHWYADTHTPSLLSVWWTNDTKKKKNSLSNFTPSHLTGLCPEIGMQSVQVAWQNQLEKVSERECKQ